MSTSASPSTRISPRAWFVMAALAVTGQIAWAVENSWFNTFVFDTITPDPQWWLAAIFATVGAVVGEAAIPFAEVITGESGWVTRELMVVLPVVGAAAFVLCPLLLPIGRWMMGVRRKKWKAMIE